MLKDQIKTLVEKIIAESREAAVSPPAPSDKQNEKSDIRTRQLNSASKTLKKLRVFDLDDTLIRTQSKVLVTKADGSKLQLTPAQYAVYDKAPGDVFDFSHFEDLILPTEIKWTTKILRRVITKRGVNAAVILTARGSKKPVETFFREFQIPAIPIVALGDSDPQAKAQWILYVIKKFNYDVVEFFDDSIKNIKAVENLRPLVPNTKIITRLIQHK